jgi:hypothetical protein
MLRNVDQFARDGKLLCCENLKGVSIQGSYGDVELREINFKFPPGIESIVLQYGDDCCFMVLHEMLEQRRYIKRLVTGCWGNASLKHRSQIRMNGWKCQIHF